MSDSSLPPSTAPAPSPDLFQGGSQNGHQGGGHSLSGQSLGGDLLTPRRVALNALQTLFTKRSMLDHVLDDNADFCALSQRDRAFVRMLVTTVVRRWGQIDDLIKRALSKPDQPLNPPILEYILRLGVAQLVFMNIPDHAAVNTSVQLAEDSGHVRLKGFVNAILRRVAAEGKDWTARQDIPRLNTPEWLLKIWIRDFGLRNALEISMANLNEAALDITLKHPDQQEHWAQTLSAQPMPGGGLRLQNARQVQELPGFHEGMWWVQDLAASLPARLFGDDLTGQRVVDLCAAPGGKTAQLAAMGADVLAVDRSAKRLQRLKENMKRLRLDDKVTTEVADAGVLRLRNPARFILLDAPCSATGTIRRNPDVMWMKMESDLSSLIELQSRLLDQALKMLEIGGVLIYCTCSLQKDEGENQIEQLLARGAGTAGVERIPIHASEVNHIPNAVTPRGDVRILPQILNDQGGIDGFFIARLTKLSD